MAGDGVTGEEHGACSTSASSHFLLPSSGLVSGAVSALTSRSLRLLGRQWAMSDGSDTAFFKPSERWKMW